MKKMILICAAALAGPALAQTSAPETKKAEPKAGSALNLRLDDPSRGGAPRITFGRQDAAGKQDGAQNGLPELGGKPKTFDRPINPGSSGSPIPKDSNPGI